MLCCSCLLSDSFPFTSSDVRSRGLYAGVQLVGQVFVDRFDENAAVNSVSFPPVSTRRLRSFKLSSMVTPSPRCIDGQELKLEISFAFLFHPTLAFSVIRKSGLTRLNLARLLFPLVLSSPVKSASLSKPDLSIQPSQMLNPVELNPS